MEQSLRVLIIDDSEDDALLIEKELRRGGYVPSCLRVEDADQMRAALEREWDIVLSDYQMPVFSSGEALELLKQTGRDIPFIIVSGLIGEETAVAAMRAGAADYVRKDSLKRLAPSIGRELAEVAVRRKRREAEERQAVSLRVLELLNRPNDTRAIINDILSFIKDATGFDAVAIRLRQGDDYPYFVQKGFSDSFIEIESSLCLRGGDGEIVRDADGKPELECICGDILKKRFDPSQSYYTDRGSFWTGDVTVLLASPEAGNIASRAQKRLSREGYRSVAVIPLYSGSEIIGLLQMNDTRVGAITEGTVLFYEAVGASIGIALKRRQLEDEIQERERLYRLITDNMTDTIWLMDMNFKYLYVTPSVERARGFTMAELNELPQYKNVTKESYERMREVTINEFSPERLDNPDLKICQIMELEFTRKNGSTFWGEITVELLRDQSGKPQYLLGTGRDVTQRKQAELRLTRSEARYRAVVDDAPFLICRFLPDGTITFVNEAYCRYFEKEPRDLIGADYKPLLYEEDQSTIDDAFRSASKENPIIHVENRVIGAGGSIRWVRWTVRGIYRGDRMLECQAIGEDVNESRLAEQALRESEDRYRRVFNTSADGMFLLDRETGRILDANEAACRTYGYTREEMLELRSVDVSAEQKQTTAALKTGLAYTPVRYHRKKNGSVFPVELAATYFDLGGRAVSVVNSRDITERIRGEETLRESEERFRSVTQSANDAMIVADDRGTILSWNNGAHIIFGYAEGEVIEKPLTVLMPERYRRDHEEGMKRYRETGEPRIINKTVELHGKRKNGSEFPLELSLSTWGSGDGVYYSAIIRDITARKKIEDAIAASLSEKEALLKEIHHRVKNNLQVISSLMGLQSAHIKKGEDMTAALSDMQNRIKSMALVHEKLYHSQNLAGIDFKEYIESVISSIFSTLVIQGDHIRVETDIRGVMLGIDTAVPCGLLLNELITNAIKHAFPHGRSGVVKVSMYRLDNEMIFLSVKDNGTGLPDGFSFDSTGTLGLRLVRILAQQVGGVISARNDNGAEFSIQFKESG